MSARRCLHALACAAVFAVAGCAARGGAVPPAPAQGATPAPPRDLNRAGAPAPETDCLATEEEPQADAEHGALDDGFEAPAASPSAAGGSAAPLPFAELTDAEIATRLRGDVGALGPMSIGQAHGGALIAGVQMPPGANWELVSPGLSWGTKETVDALAHAIDAVAARFPSTPKAFIGNISAKQGGHLPPHVSHQSGRDVDLGYYLREGHRWYAPANAANLDRPRTWQLVRTLIADSDVDLILIDLKVQHLLKSYALEIGEDAAWLDQIFQAGGKSQRPIVFHAHGHATHLHVRFYSPAAQELGRRAYRVLVARRLLAAPTLHITHVTKAGETLSHLALHYKVTPVAIKKANAMTSDVLRVNKPYKIPRAGGVPVPERVALPARRVPPSPAAVASAGAKPGRDGEPCLRTAAPDPGRSGG
ncbi:MAG TPA: penicillin-insensitive murein endopeptidase [Labilithrix sp.]|nr:penicillin-insensitive murein endopeptidase [Labilithrix sp.]